MVSAYEETHANDLLFKTTLFLVIYDIFGIISDRLHQIHYFFSLITQHTVAQRHKGLKYKRFFFLAVQKEHKNSY